MRIETSTIDNIIVNTIIYEQEDYRSESEKIIALNICDTCEKFNNNSCSECGCIVESLVYLKTNSCPLNKW